jgi:hypothetical protein
LKQALNELLEELRKMVGNLKYAVISSNIPIKRDGNPYITGHSIKPKDPGVAVYWYDVTAKTERVIACDAWVEARENIRALALALRALRQLERCKATEILDRAFSGFAALTDGQEPWWVVLGVEQGSSPAVIKDTYHILAKTHHPDVGGDHVQMVKISKAYQEALEGNP